MNLPFLCLHTPSLCDIHEWYKRQEILVLYMNLVSSPLSIRSFRLFSSNTYTTSLWSLSWYLISSWLFYKNNVFLFLSHETDYSVCSVKLLDIKRVGTDVRNLCTIFFSRKTVHIDIHRKNEPCRSFTTAIKPSFSSRALSCWSCNWSNRSEQSSSNP